MNGNNTLFSEPIIITAGPDSLSVIQGQSVSFRCLFNYKDKTQDLLDDVTVSWFKNGKKVDGSFFKSERLNDENGFELSVQDVQLNDAGYYQLGIFQMFSSACGVESIFVVSF